MVDTLRGCRPYPLDKERKERCLSVLQDAGLTMTELAFHLGCSQQLVSDVLSGRRITAVKQREIAEFLGVPEDFLFPLRTSREIAQMRQAEAAEKARKEAKKAERMALRQRALGVA